MLCTIHNSIKNIDSGKYLIHSLWMIIINIIWLRTKTCIQLRIIILVYIIYQVPNIYFIRYKSVTIVTEVFRLRVQQRVHVKKNKKPIYLKTTKNLLLVHFLPIRNKKKKNSKIEVVVVVRRHNATDLGRFDVDQDTILIFFRYIKIW